MDYVPKYTLIVSSDLDVQQLMGHVVFYKSQNVVHGRKGVSNDCDVEVTLTIFYNVKYIIVTQSCEYPSTESEVLLWSEGLRGHLENILGINIGLLKTTPDGRYLWWWDEVRRGYGIET